MTFVGKDWQDAPSTATPITALALEDLETRVTTYADQHAGDSGAIVLLGNVTGAVNVDLTQGITFSCTMTGDTTFTFTNWPGGQVETEALIYATQGGVGNHAITVTGVAWEPTATAPVWDMTAGHTNAILVGSPDNGITIIGQGTPTFVSYRRDICPFVGYTIIQGTWASAAASGALCGQLTNSTKALNDAISFDIGMEPGTWTLSILSATFTDRGIATVAIDGTNVGTMDMYSAGAVVNALKTIAGIVVTTAGHHTLTFTAATKNASASAYLMCFEWIMLQRTA